MPDVNYERALLRCWNQQINYTNTTIIIEIANLKYEDSRFVIFYFMNRIQAKMQIELKYSLSAILITQLNKTLYTLLF